MKDVKMLFRHSLSEENELNVAKEHFDVVESRVMCYDALVIGRYSVLPFYKELEKDLRLLGCELINTHREHLWVADFEYYEQLKDYTFESWTDASRLPDDGTQFVVKGKTNSRKFKWDTDMFATSKRQAIEIGIRLGQDSMIGWQDIIYRRYVPLVTYEVGINGLPFTNEWRFFFYKDKMLSYGYYWSLANSPNGSLTDEGIMFAKEVARIASEHCTFFVIDIAEKQGGGWILVEINDGQMSGLCENKADILYKNLRIAITQKEESNKL